MKRLLVVPAWLLAAVAVAGPVSAAFGDTAAATTGVLTGDVLVGPSGLSAGSPTCVGGLFGLLATPAVPLSWTRATSLSSSTSSLRDQSVRVLVGATSYAGLTTSPVTASSTSASAYGYVDGLGVQRPLSGLTSYTFEVRTLWGSWSSPATTVSRTTGLC